MEAVLFSRRKLTIFKNAQTLNSKAQSFESRNFCQSCGFGKIRLADVWSLGFPSSMME